MQTATVNDKPNRKFSVKWIEICSEISDEVISTTVNLCWQCWRRNPPPSSVEDWCIKVLGWTPSDLVNAIGPLSIAILKNAKDPGDLSIVSCLELIEHVIPVAPCNLIYLIHKIRSMKYIGYRLDFEMNSRCFQALMQKLNEYVVEIFKIMKEMFKKVFEDDLKRLSTELKSKKKKYRKIELEILSHKPFLNKTRFELEEAKKSLDSYIKFEEMEINTSESSSSAVKPKATFNKHRRSTVSDFSIQVLSDLTSISMDEFNESFDKVKLKKKLINNKNRKESDFSERPSEILEEVEEGIFLEEAFRVRLDSNASAESVSLSLTGKISKYEGKIYHLQEKRGAMLKIAERLFNDLGRTQNEVLRMFRTRIPDDTVEDWSEYYESASKGIPKLINEARLECHEKAKTKSVLDLHAWFSDKQVKYHEANDMFLIRMVAKGSHISVNLNLVIDPPKGDRVSLIIGPSGSGKSHLGHYILQMWHSSPYKYLGIMHYDVAILIYLDEVRKFESFSKFFEKRIFVNMASEMREHFLNVEPHTLKSLLMVDSDYIREPDYIILKDIVKQTFTRILITIRPEYGAAMDSMLNSNGIRPTIFNIKPVDICALSPEGRQILGIKEDLIHAFTKVVESPYMDPNILTPLHISFILFVFNYNDIQADYSTSKSKLVAHLLNICNERVASHKPVASNQPLRETKDNGIEMADFSQKLSAVPAVNDGKYYIDNAILINLWDMCWTKFLKSSFSGSETLNFKLSIEPYSFFPLILPQHDDTFIMMNQVCESLTGFHYFENVTAKSTSLLKPLSCCKPYDSLPITSENAELNREPLLISAGLAILSSKFKEKLFSTLINDFKASMSSRDYFVMWVRLIKETNYSEKVCQLVAKTLKDYKTWTTCSGVGCSDAAVSTLLKHEAFSPRSIVISERCPAVTELVCGLALCRKIDIALRQLFQFCVWESNCSSDELVESLQPTGNLIEFWGYLRAEGCMALRQMKRLKILHVRLTSLEALVNLSLSLNHIKSLQELFINFDLPKRNPVSTMPRLPFKGKRFVLSFHGVRDSTLPWAMEVINKLYDSYESIYFEKTKLSLDNFHSIKKCGSTTSVYIV